MRTTAQIRRRFVSSLRLENAQAEVERLSGLAKVEPFRTIRLAILGASRNNDLLWASALTYTSSLSLVPILALAFSALAGLGGTDRIRPLIERYLAVNSPEITNTLMGYINNTSATALGEVGGAILLVTVVLTLSTVEQAFNSIFNVSRGRTWLRKFSDYLSVVFTVPLLLVAAVPARSGLMLMLPHVPDVGWAVSTLLIWTSFSFLYVFFPNIKVRLGAAAIGGLVASILLQVGQWGYVHFQIGAVRYHAIYGGLAAVPILLTWIYTAWIIVLFGAELTAVLQGIEPTFEIDHRTPGFVRIAALLTVFRAGERMLMRTGARPCTVHLIAGELGVSETAMRPIVERLKHGGILIESVDSSLFGNGGHELFLARDSSKIPLSEVLGCLENQAANPSGDQRIAAIIESVSAAEHELLGGLTVLDLVNGKITVAPSSVPAAVHEQ
jgi:membrane protein